eukprot:6441292-Pyramimonas_sp.AAC.1
MRAALYRGCSQSVSRAVAILWNVFRLLPFAIDLPLYVFVGTYIRDEALNFFSWNQIPRVLPHLVLELLPFRCLHLVLENVPAHKSRCAENK